MSTVPWPPEFTLDQEKILRLLTGDRFYSNPSAALREAILNAIDAVHRRRLETPSLKPNIQVTFDSDSLTLTVADNGVGMGPSDVSVLFTKVGASATTREAHKTSVGEFGIGVISYFMAGDSFVLHTSDGKSNPIGLSFDRRLLSGGRSTLLTSTQTTRGTTITIHVHTDKFRLLLDTFPHWCRDVEGLHAELLPDHRPLAQHGAPRYDAGLTFTLPTWVQRAHLGPVSDPPGWDAMTGTSKVAVLYRGIFVQEFEIRGLWGIEGSIDVDPEHFKPRLNREGFVDGQFQTDVGDFLRSCHPSILEAMVQQLSVAFAKGALDKWTVKRWANLWLSLPRSPQYAHTAQTWDSVFRRLPAFELAAGSLWKPVSVDALKRLPPNEEGEIYVAPLPDEQTNEVVQAALRFLRNTGRSVVRGIRRDKSWMRYAGTSFATTADLISGVFAAELPNLVPIAARAEKILATIQRIAPLFTGPPAVDLVRIGHDSLPVLRLRDRLVVNIDHEAGKTLVEEALRANAGPMALIESAARHAHEQLTQVAAVVRGAPSPPEILGPIRRRFIRSLLS